MLISKADTRLTGARLGDALDHLLVSHHREPYAQVDVVIAPRTRRSPGWRAW